MERESPNSDSEDLNLAHVALYPEVQAAHAIAQYSQEFGQLEITPLLYALKELSSKVKSGDMSRMESMLTMQASTLNAVFGRLLVQALDAPCLDKQEQIMRLAFKAQSQCRATIESLAAIKSPRQVAFVQQANIAAGPQQVNNFPPGRPTERARKIEKQPNELLGNDDGKRMDIRAQGKAGSADPAVAPVGEVQRSQKRRRQGGSVT